MLTSCTRDSPATLHKDTAQRALLGAIWDSLLTSTYSGGTCMGGASKVWDLLGVQGLEV